MAKKADKPEGAADQVAASAEDVQLAMRACQDITGCGEPEARRRIQAMSGKKVAEIAQLERDGKRSKIVAILF